MVTLWWVILKSFSFQFHNEEVIEKLIFDGVCASKVVYYTQGSSQPPLMREGIRNQFMTNRGLAETVQP